MITAATCLIWIDQILSSKEVWKSNFRQYGQMKSRDGKSQREEKSRREKIREEKESEERSLGARKGRKVAKHSVFPFPMICGSGGSKSRLAKRRVRSHLARWEMKKCTPLWREAHLQVKNLKTPHIQITFGSWDVEKVHAVVARSTFQSQNVKNTRVSDHFWTFRCRFAWQAQGIVHLLKSEFPKLMAGVGHLKRIFQDGFRVAGGVQETCSSEMPGGQGADFLRGVTFWSIRSSDLLRWFCVTGADFRMTWHHFFVAGAAL